MRIRIFKVSEITSYIKNLLTRDIILSGINLDGEITNLSRHINGHIFFSLKDEFSKIQCVMFSSDANNLNFDALDGIEVRVKGRLDLYSKEGRYQLIVTSMLPKGVAEGYEKFLILKEKLSKKGYFDEELKKEIRAVKKIGLITSKSGAAIHDFLKVLERRNPFIEVFFYPSLVQGSNAANSIVNGLEKLSEIKDLDCIVISRGGGSKEDLSAFNDEKLADQIYKMDIPIVSAVGHEIDITICDMCSDLRAATPTEAAELLTEDFYKNLVLMNYAKDRLNNSINNKVSSYMKNIEHYSPNRFNEYINSLLEKNLQNINNQLMRCRSIIESRLLNKKLSLDYSIKILENLNPDKLLKKGYAIVRNNDKNNVSRAKSIKKNEELKIQFYDGTIQVKVK